MATILRLFSAQGTYTYKSSTSIHDRKSGNWPCLQVEVSCQQFWWRLLFYQVFLGPQGNYFVCRWSKWEQGWAAESYPGLINTSTLMAEFGGYITRTLIPRLHCAVPAPHDITSSRWQCSYLGWSGLISVHQEKVEVFCQPFNTSSKTLKPEQHYNRARASNRSQWIMLDGKKMGKAIFKRSTPENHLLLHLHTVRQSK